MHKKSRSQGLRKKFITHFSGRFVSSSPGNFILGVWLPSIIQILKECACIVEVLWQKAQLAVL